MARHLAKQGEPCVDVVGGQCRYRNGDGLRCAVGALIPDDRYFDEMDTHEDGSGMTAKHLFDNHLEAVRDDCQQADRSLVYRMQEIHDCVVPGGWKEACLQVAEQHRLDPTATLDAFALYP